MTDLIFNNRPNPIFFHSRSVAVLVVPFFSLGNSIWIPLGQRSSSVSDSGKWCVPCGYLDWDESGKEAAIREAYEELGLDLADHIHANPWFVQTDPSQDARQNITLRYISYCECETLPALVYNKNECVDAKWMCVDDAIKSLDLAFNQAEVIKESFEFISNQRLKDLWIKGSCSHAQGLASVAIKLGISEEEVIRKGLQLMSAYAKESFLKED